MPTDIATFDIHAFTEVSSNKDHLAITIGKLNSSPVLARIHSQCITGESFFSMRCDCRFQLTESLNQIANNGSGVIFYLQQEGRGIGLSNKIKAYKLQDDGMDTVEITANYSENPVAYMGIGFGADTSKGFQWAIDLGLLQTAGPVVEGGSDARRKDVEDHWMFGSVLPNLQVNLGYGF